MTLPVSADYPIAPFTQYDLFNPPFVPPINVMPGCESVVPMIAATIANEACLKADKHPGRMFLYNLLVDNYWNNPIFSEVVKLATDIVALNYNKGHIRSPEQGVQDAVALAMGGYSSTLFVNYPDLKGIVAPQVLEAAYQNMSVFNSLKQEISSMYYNTPGQPGHAGHGHPNMGANAHAPMYPGGHHVPPVMHHPGMHMHPGAGGPGFPNHNGWGAPPPAPQQWNAPPHAQAHWGHGPVQSNYPARSMSSGPTFSGGVTNARFGQVEQESSAVHDRFASRPSGNVSEPVMSMPVKTQAPQEAQVEKEEQQTLIIKENSEMDRSKHQIVLLGESYKPRTADRYADYTTAVNELGRSRPTESLPENAVVEYSWAIEPCLDRAIVHGRAKQYRNQEKNSVDKVFRCFSVLASPYICGENVTDYMDALKDATSFTTLATKIKSIATSLAMKETDETRQYTSSVAMFLSQIDNKLTSVVNEFLTCNLRLITNVDSFVEDIATLPQYLYERYGGDYSRAFERFEQEVIDSMLCQLNEDLIRDHMTYFDIDGMEYGLMPTTCSITFVHLTDKELGFKIDTTAAVAIDQFTAPTLFKLASSLVDHKRQLQTMESPISVMEDYLVTADNVRYKLYRNPLRQDEYLIAKA